MCVLERMVYIGAGCILNDFGPNRPIIPKERFLHTENHAALSHRFPRPLVLSNQ